MLDLLIAINDDYSTVLTLQMLLLILLHLLLPQMVLAQQCLNGSRLLACVLIDFGSRGIHFGFAEFGVPARAEFVLQKRRFLFLTRFSI